MQTMPLQMCIIGLKLRYACGLPVESHIEDMVVDSQAEEIPSALSPQEELSVDLAGPSSTLGLEQHAATSTNVPEAGAFTPAVLARGRLQFSLPKRVMPDVLPRHPKSDACRLCLVSAGQMEHIFSDPVLTSTITETVQLKMFEGDGLPDQICQPCIDHLNAASRFIQRCHMSDSELRLPLYKECGRSAELEVISSDNTELAIEEPRLDGDWACSLTPIKVEQESAGYATGFSEVNLKAEVVEHTFETVDPLEPTASSSASWQCRESDEVATTSPIENAFSFGEDGVLIEPMADAAPELRGESFLPSHLLLDLPTEAPLLCPLCSKSFTTHKALRCHINMGHMQKNRQKDDPYLQFTPNTPDRSRLWCSQCNAGFLERDELVKHVRTHRGQSSYCCSRCDKEFHSQQALKVHTKTHAKEKRYKCTKCDKSFSLRSYFRVHELTHKR